MGAPNIVGFDYLPAGVGQGIRAHWSDNTYPSVDLAAMNALLNPNDVVQYLEGLITAAGGGTYTLLLPIPAGATVRDVVLSNDVLWDSATSAAISIGDADAATGYFSAVNLKSAPAVDGTTGGGVSSLLAGTGHGTYSAKFKRYPTGGNVIAVVTAVGAGSAGRTRVRAYFSVPSVILSAVKS